MLKSSTLGCLVLFQVIVAITGQYNEDLENSFLPYRRESEIEPINESIKTIIGDHKGLTNLEKKLLSSIKSISIIEFDNDKKEDINGKLFQVIDATLDLTKKDVLSGESHTITKRSILPKYKSAALAYFGAALKSRSHKRGKRSVAAFQKPSLTMLQYFKPPPQVAPQPQNTYEAAPAPLPQVVAQPQNTYEAVPAPLPQVVAQPQNTYEMASTYQSHNSYESSPAFQPQATLPQEEALVNTCEVGTVEPIYEGQFITETYCRCPTGTYGLNCQENFVNPCVENGLQYHPADLSVGPNYFLECNWNTPYLFKCPRGLVWNQEIQTCDWQFVQQFEAPVDTNQILQGSQQVDQYQTVGY